MSDPSDLTGKAVAAAWPLFGYAPGMYTFTCLECGKNSMQDGSSFGDKRTITCLECAVIKAKEEIDRLTRELAEATKDRDYWKVEAEGERAKVAFRDKMTGDPDAIADRVVNAIHAEFNINLIGKADNQRLRSAVARALKEKP